MKVVMAQLVLITAAFLSGVAAVTVMIRAYNATGELDSRRYSFTLGTRVLLTCDVTGLPEGSEVVNYRWYHNCAGRPNSRCEIQDGDPYYRVVKDSLLVDVTSLNQGGRYYCTVQHQQETHRGVTRQETQMAVAREPAVADNPGPFLYTPISLLLEHSVLTDVQQARGRNGHQWITCRSGREGTRPEIWMGSERVVNSSFANSVTIGLGIQHSNGLYHCFSAQSQREYFSLYLSNSVTLPTPTVSAGNTTMWTLTSPDGSRVERYIVAFECRVRNITFVEKFMSVSTSGGTGRVSKNVSCFGGLGQLYRVKVWAVNGPNISRALVFVTAPTTAVSTATLATATTAVSTATLATPTTPTTAVNTATPTTPATAVNTATPTTPATAVNTETPTTPATAVNTETPTKPTTAFNTATPTGPHPSSTGEHPTNTIFIGAGIGVGIFFLLVLSIVVVLIVVVVVVNRKAACKPKRDSIVNDNPYFNNTVVVSQELEMVDQGVGGDHNDAHSCQGVGNNQGEGEDLLNFDVGYNPYEVADREVLGKNTMTPTPKVSSTPASATKVDAVYAVVDKSKKKGAKKKTADEPTVVNKDDLYAMPMAKAVKMTDEGGGVVVSGGLEEWGHYDDVVELTNADRIP